MDFFSGAFFGLCLCAAFIAALVLWADHKSKMQLFFERTRDAWECKIISYDLGRSAIRATVKGTTARLEAICIAEGLTLAVREISAGVSLIVITKGV